MSRKRQGRWQAQCGGLCEKRRLRASFVGQGLCFLAHARSILPLQRGAREGEEEEEGAAAGWALAAMLRPWLFCSRWQGLSQGFSRSGLWPEL